MEGGANVNTVDARCEICDAPIKLKSVGRRLCYACACDLAFIQKQADVPIGYYADGTAIYA